LLFCEQFLRGFSFLLQFFECGGVFLLLFGNFIELFIGIANCFFALF